MNAIKEHLLSFLKGVGALIGIAVVWWGVAAVLLFLAGGIGPGLLDVFYIFWPVSFAVLAFLSAIDGGLEKGFRLGWPNYGRPLRLGPAFGTALALYSSPIILNLLHLGFRLVGWTDVATLLYNIRWFSAPILVIGALVIFGILVLASELSGWLREGAGSMFLLSV